MCTVCVCVYIYIYIYISIAVTAARIATASCQGQPLVQCHLSNARIVQQVRILAQDKGGPSKGAFLNDHLFSYTDLYVCNDINGVCIRYGTLFRK